MAKVSVANKTLMSPSEKRISIVSFRRGKSPKKIKK